MSSTVPPPPPPRPSGSPKMPTRPKTPGKAEMTFNSALERPTAEREAYVVQACGEDTVLMAEVRELLKAYEAAEGFMKTEGPLSPEVEEQLARLKPEEAGDVIGAYKLREQLGEGGFGTVWVADQAHPVRRRVALKIIKLGMDTKEVIARFEQERQALAMMDHPNIAKVLDAGATQFGRPFFAMELVRGVKITEYCDEHKLSTQERIELFITVCQAVQHAHQKGVIHRDIKPSNILVTVNDGVAVPKVIDFGVAKATQGRLTEQTVYTQFQQMIGTPLYMSPEQAEMTSLDIDTRSDIYSLGVLLYELLTGHTPIEQDTLARVGLDEIRRLIREVDPPRPSIRLKTLDGAEMTTAATRRKTEPAKLAGTLRGDIDWIVMKCLEKDRGRRYDTANGLALDLQRHLKNEVITARPPTAGYLLGKLIRRNKLAFAAGAAIAASLVIGIAASVWQAVRAKSAERRAVAALDELRASAPAFAEQARGLAAREQYADAIAKLDYAIKLRPDAAEYLVAKGDLLQCQLKLAEAVAAYREALRGQPGLARAEASAKLCDELLAAPLSEQGKLTRESLAKLHVAMQKQQRPAAELMPVARLLGEEKKLVVEYWLARFKDLPVSAEKPLKDRLTVRDDGRLALDLSDTKVLDLSPLAGAPLAVLNVSSTKERSDLTDLAPLRGIDLVELNISGTSVADLTPLQEMRGLRKLDVSITKVTDLAPLSDLRLEELTLRGTRIFDLAALRGMELKELGLGQTRVADLSPLAGMPLTIFEASTIPATDYSPLTGAPLEKCVFQNSPVRDLSFLRDSPVKELVLYECNELRGYSVLAGLKSLDLLVLPQSFRSLPEEDLAAIGALRSHPTLRNIQTEDRTSGRWYFNTAQPKETFWQDWDREQIFVPALRKIGIKFSLRKLPIGTYSLSIQDQPLSDLSVLKGAPISELYLSNCKFTDLTPIHDLKLEVLHLSSDLVTDLSPLRGMPLKTLFLSGTKISDLSPLPGLPLRELYLDACPGVADLTLLAQIPTLEKLTVPVQAANINALRKLPALQLLGVQRNGATLQPATTAAAFWKLRDANPWIARLRDSGIKTKALRSLDDGTFALDLNNTPITDLTLLKGAPIGELTLSDTAVSDLSPLRGMPLRSLYLGNTRVADLTPLSGMPLTRMTLNGTPVADVTPLRGMALEYLHIGSTEVADLEPLRGMPLKDLILYSTKVTDLRPLQGMPLEQIIVSKVSDLAVLRGMPLRSLRLHQCPKATDFSPLAELKELTSLTLPADASGIDFLRTFPKLARIGFKEDWNNGGRPDKTAAEFWKEYDSQSWQRALRDAGITIKSVRQLPDGTWNLDLGEAKITDLAILKGAPISSLRLWKTAVTDLRPLHGLPLKKLILDDTAVTDLRPLQGMPIEELDLRRIKITDLAALRGMPLKKLQLGDNAITDLEPLRGLALTELGISKTKVTDLSPLQGMPLEYLDLNRTEVTDLSVVRGMPLTKVRLRQCAQLTDLSPLAEAKGLTSLSLPPNPKDIEFLRAFPKLERLSFMEGTSDTSTPDKTAAEFWKEYDAKKQAAGK